MSRIGKKPIEIPKGVKVEVSGSKVSVSGPKGSLQRQIKPEIKVAVDGNVVKLERDSEEKVVRASHGAERALLANMIAGVSSGFVKQLELIGVGYRADVKGDKLDLDLGYSHPILFSVSKGVKAEVIKDGRRIFVKLEGADKQLVGQVAAKLRTLRPPEPYKGKGVRYMDEVVKLKAGKKK